jgi:hypothetical protein
MTQAQLSDRDKFQEAMDKVLACKINPVTFPHDQPLAFRHAAVELLHQIELLRFRMEGGNQWELDDLEEAGLIDDTFAINLNDLRSFVETFHTERNQRNYAACAATLDWVMATAGPGEGESV